MSRIDTILELAQDVETYIEKQNITNKLLYVSPEGTRRLNLEEGYRASFYTIGVMIYEFVSGRYPFADNGDDMQLIYAHATLKETNLIDIKNIQTPVPFMLSSLVEKLLNKNPLKRYNSLESIIYDLKCIQKDDTKEFVLASTDKHDTFEISEKIYGRDSEAKLVIKALNSKTKELLIIAGNSGVGKSTLISKVRNEIKNPNIFFTKEKFQQQQSTQTFSVVGRAISRYIRSIVIQESAKISALEEIFIFVLGENIQLMLDFVPELSLIVKSTYKLNELQPSETQSRFNITFVKFMKIITEFSQKVVLVIDDMQWCDLSSINLIELLLKDDAINNMALILAYRDDEVKSNHPFSIMLSSCEKRSGYEKLKLLPLDLDEVALMLYDSFGVQNENIKKLSITLKDKTDGNPFFIKTLVTNLYEDGFILYNKEESSWQCDIETVLKMNISPNIVTSVTKKIDKLDKDMKSLLAYASLIGTYFNIDILGEVLGKDKLFIDILFKKYKDFVIKINEDEYKFVHDKVQEAFMLCLDEDEKKQFHYKLGSYLETSATHTTDIFTIANHFNDAQDLVISSKQKDDLFNLNYECAESLAKSNSYAPAIYYLESARALQDENRWGEDYERSIKLSTFITEVYYLNLEFEKAKEYFDEIFKEAKNLNDKIKITQIEIFSLIAQNKSQESLDLGLGILKEYGLELPKEDDFTLYYPKLFELYDKKHVSDFKLLPPMTNVEMLHILDILNSIMAPAYQTAPHLYPKICYVAIDMCIKGGNSAAATNVYAVHALLLSAFFGEFEHSKEFAQLSQELIVLYDAQAYTAKVNMIANACVNHWSSELSSTLPELKDTVIKGIEVGDFEYACYNNLYYTMNSLFSGKNTQELQSDFAVQAELMRGLRQSYQLRYSSVLEEFLFNLNNFKAEPLRLKGDFFDEETTLDSLVTDNNISILYNFYQAKAHLGILYEDFESAYKFMQEAKKYHIGVASLYQYGEFFFYEAVTSYSYYKKGFGSQREELLDLLETAIKYYDSLCLSAIENNLHKKELLQALYLELKGDALSWKHFDSAAKNASKYGFTHMLGMIYQYASYYWSSVGMDDFKDMYLVKTYETYKRWGAEGVCEYLLKTNPNRLHSQDKYRDEINSFDMKSVLKASQTLSKELEVDELLKVIMEIVVENSSSQTGYLFLEVDGQFELDVSYIDGKFTRENKQKSVPLNLLKYVKNTKKDIVLTEANRDELFQIDDYLRVNTPASMYCSKIFLKGEFSGVLYLENQELENIYTIQKIEILQLLIAQASSSIENAYLFEEISGLNLSLENRVAQRTSELQDVIVDLEKSQAELKLLSSTDSMTHLHNRRHFTVISQQMFHVAKRGKTELSMLMLDIDLFKNINDTYGHDVGDDVIIFFASLMKSMVRASDMIFRFGGEEFLILLPNTSLDSAQKIAQKIRKKTKDSLITINENLKVNFSVSIGVSIVSEDDEDIKKALLQSDKALYRAKESGRDKVCIFGE